MSEHEHEHEDELYTVIIPDEDGNEVEMMVVETFDIHDDHYAVLLEKDNLEADAVILKVKEEEGEMYLTDISDDEEWERVVQVYEKLVDAQDVDDL